MCVRQGKRLKKRQGFRTDYRLQIIRGGIEAAGADGGAAAVEKRDTVVRGDGGGGGG